METSMGPPLLPAYSLRVMLFRADAHGEGNKPIRCFRVVTSPEVKVRDFCEEASRIHEINYGEPISIKKVQDDQEFDITQGEILGSLFANLSTIRVIQTSNHPGVRDSLPPTSALRFDPGTSRKRGRAESFQANGVSQSNSWNSNKRQRVLPADPDQPLPSREIETKGRRGSLNMTPEAQGRTLLRPSNGVDSRPCHVRRALHRIPETPSPPPSTRKTISGNGLADHQNNQSDIQNTDDDPNHPDHASLTELSRRAQSHISNSPWAKNASYHIPRPNERGASVSTAATTPLSADQQLPETNNLAAANKRKRPQPTLPPHNGRSPSENSIYENITSDEEGPAILKAKKAALRQKSSPHAGLPGLEWANKRNNTSPNGIRQGSGIREPATMSGELPLTPSSKEREENTRRGIENAGIAAAEVSERRKREADEVQQADAIRIAAEERAKREEEERLDVERFRRNEAARKASIAKQKAGDVKVKKEAEERKRREEARVTKEKADRERLQIEKADAAEAKRLRDDLEKDQHEKATAAEKARKAQEEAEKTRLPSSSPEEALPTKSSSPILPRSTQSFRAQSSTPFIPLARKSALKNPMSSQATKSSSPTARNRSSVNLSTDVDIESQMPLPKTNRRVSFQNEMVQTETPVPPPSRILPPPRTYTPTAITPKKHAVKPVAKTPIVQAKTQSPIASGTAILPPRRQTAERNIVPKSDSKIGLPVDVAATSKARSPPHATKKVSPPASQNVIRPNGPSPSIPAIMKKVPPTSSQVQKGEAPVVPKKISPPVLQSSQATRNTTVVRPPVLKEMIKSTFMEQSKRQLDQQAESSSEDSDSDKKKPDVTSLNATVKQTSSTKKPSSHGEVVEESENSNYEDGVEDHEVDKDDTQSQNSSTRDSRSPVSFIQHSKADEPPQSQRAASPESDTSSEDEEMVDAVDDDAPVAKDRSLAITAAKGVGLDSDSDDSSGDDEETQIQVPQSSPPVLPMHNSITKPVMSKLNLVTNRKSPLPDEGCNTQDQVDQQLTSSFFEAHSSFPAVSTPTPIPASSAAVKPPVIKFGASLSSLNQNKVTLGSSSQAKPVATRSGQPLHTLSLADQSASESESESEDDDSSSSSDDSSSDDGDHDGVSNAKSFPLTTPSALSKQDQSARPDSDSDEADSDDSDTDEGEAEKIRARNLLAKQVAAMGNSSQGSIAFPSPKRYSLSTQQESTPKVKEKKAEKNPDRYVSGYQFSIFK